MKKYNKDIYHYLKLTLAYKTLRDNITEKLYHYRLLTLENIGYEYYYKYKNIENKLRHKELEFEYKYDNYKSNYLHLLNKYDNTVNIPSKESCIKYYIYCKNNNII